MSVNKEQELTVLDIEEILDVMKMHHDITMWNKWEIMLPVLREKFPHLIDLLRKQIVVEGQINQLLYSFKRKLEKNNENDI